MGIERRNNCPMAGFEKAVPVDKKLNIRYTFNLQSFNSCRYDHDYLVEISLEMLSVFQGYMFESLDRYLVPVNVSQQFDKHVT